MRVQYDLFKNYLRRNKGKPGYHWSWFTWYSFNDWDVPAKEL